MSLSIGTSLAAYTVALEREAASLAGASVDDEVQVAFEHGQLHGPSVVAPLWSDKADPPTHNATTESMHPDLHAALPSHERMHPAAATSKSDSLPQEFLEIIGGTAASVAFVVGAFTLGPTASTLLTAYFAGLGPRD